MDRLLIDDFPKDRDNDAIKELANEFGYRVILHDKNMSIGATWEEAWSEVRDGGYDYIWHQEDDVLLLQSVPIVHLIQSLNSVSNASQVVLKRQPWYPHEVPSKQLPDDIALKHFRGEFSAAKYYFTPIASLYSIDRVRFDYKAWYREHYPDEPMYQTANINEALIGKALLEGFGLQSLHLKTWLGRHIIEHIGEWSWGQRLLPGEPGYEAFEKMDPEKKYWSTHQRLWTEPESIVHCAAKA